LPTPAAITLPLHPAIKSIAFKKDLLNILFTFLPWHWKTRDLI
tara:strand:- start:11 stop:139 length:129 start_codon:yes stop_codon:yes gene_type:complete